MNDQTADKFATLLARCAVTGDSADLRKEAAAQELLKEAVDPAAVGLGALLGAGIGGAGGYFGTEDEKRKKRNALYGALTGGLLGAGTPLALGGMRDANAALNAAGGLNSGEAGAATDAAAPAAPGESVSIKKYKDPSTASSAARALSVSPTHDNWLSQLFPQLKGKPNIATAEGMARAGYDPNADTAPAWYHTLNYNNRGFSGLMAALGGGAGWRLGGNLSNRAYQANVVRPAEQAAKANFLQNFADKTIPQNATGKPVDTSGLGKLIERAGRLNIENPRSLWRWATGATSRAFNDAAKTFIPTPGPMGPAPTAPVKPRIPAGTSPAAAAQMTQKYLADRAAYVKAQAQYAKDTAAHAARTREATGQQSSLAQILTRMARGKEPLRDGKKLPNDAAVAARAAANANDPTPPPQPGKKKSKPPTPITPDNLIHAHGAQKGVDLASRARRPIPPRPRGMGRRLGYGGAGSGLGYLLSDPALAEGLMWALNHRNAEQPPAK